MIHFHDFMVLYSPFLTIEQVIYFLMLHIQHLPHTYPQTNKKKKNFVKAKIKESNKIYLLLPMILPIYIINKIKCAFFVVSTLVLLKTYQLTISKQGNINQIFLQIQTILPTRH